MSKPTMQPALVPSRQELHRAIDAKVIEVVEVLLGAELTAVVGSGPYERTEVRHGYRHGTQRRRLTTQHGPVEVRVPRARLRRPDGSTTEFQSTVLPRYSRRTRRVDEAILGAYLAGANTRRIRKALEPLLGEANLSKSAVSRVVARLKELFASWDRRDLSGERFAIVYLDAKNLRVRLARRVIKVPVLVALGVAPDGRKQLVALRLAVRETAASWRELLEDLKRRGLGAPALIVSDGHPGLAKAIELWPASGVQRCTVHKLRNLYEHCPKHAHAELGRDYHRIIYAKDAMAARQAYEAFVAKWRRLCPAVARSLEQAGAKLLTFYEWPRAMWRSLRTTNTIENLNREFERRTKTQASFATEQAAVTLLYGLVAFGQIHLRRIDGWRHLTTMIEQHWKQVA
jgi:putative transposase